ncbi:peptidylprolyl isomerase [Comamonas nitrativorans]|uniref:Chaperone SurA n=1 Tax=Comamonas nitrativorans TaxID=108437 RepID=A0ABV9GYY6_9BURK
MLRLNTLSHPFTLGLTCLVLACASNAAPTAQDAPGQPAQTSLEKALTQSATPTPVAGPRTADFIVAIVNSEPITRNEVQVRSQRVLQAMAQQGSQSLPTLAQLAPEVLERLIAEKAQVQQARETGIRVDDFAVQQAVLNVAAQSGGTLADLQAELRRQGISETRFRQEIRDQLMMQRLRERDVNGRVKVTDQDIDQYLAEQKQRGDQGPAQALNLGHILIAVPENAPAAQTHELEQRAQQAVQALRSGVDLQTVAKRYSDAGEPEMGLRPADRYPQAFVQAVGTTPVGGLIGPLRSPAGFHILVVLDKSATGVPSVVTQNHARHILLRPSAQMSEEQAAAQLQELRQRIERGQASFAQLAQQYSQDGSAPEGGDLGWSSPGQFVPEFEQALDRLQPGEISQPIVSRFGVHLIQLEDRRQVTLNPRQQREMLRNVVREEKLEKAYANWLQELRGQAYVEYRNTEANGQ